MASHDILVTGSSGHLGTALMLTLPSMGFKPIGIDILPAETTHHVGSISDRNFVRSVLRNNPIRHILHTATLHKPHVDSHSKEAFIETNITGTLFLLEEAAKLGEQIQGFIFFSTTSTFGAALQSRPGSPACWIHEQVAPIPKNIYGVTKVAAEDMCSLIQRQTGMPILVLKVSRFFPEQDDDADRRAELGDDNLKVMELAYRRVDLEDIVSAAVCAMQKAKDIRWAKYIISAPSPFRNDPDTMRMLDENPAAVYEAAVPVCKEVFQSQGWGYLARIDRVYDSSKAVEELGWTPKYTFQKACELIAEGKDWRSELTKTVGKKGYHATTTGVYTTRE